MMLARSMLRFLFPLALFAVAGLARAQDAGVPDAGPPDAGPPDSGAPTEEPPLAEETPEQAPEDSDDAPEDSDDPPTPDADPTPEEPAPEEQPPQEPPAEPDPLDEELDAEALLDEAFGDDEAEGEGDSEAPVDGDDAIDLREITVVYTPEDILRLGGSAQLLEEEQLSTLEYDDPHSVLLQVPGVYVRTEDGFGLRPNIGLRGGNPERSKKVTLMEDGVLFGPAPYAAPAAYYFPLMGRMTGVEVFKGPSALLYGPQTIGGAVNLLTRRVPQGSEGAAEVSFGMYGGRTAHLWWGASNDRMGLVVEGLHVGSEGFKEIDGSNRDSGFNRTDVMIRGFVQSDPSARIFHRVELKLGLGIERSNETYLGLTNSDFEADPNRRYAASALDRMEWWRTQGQLSWRMDVGENISLTTDLYRHDFERSWFRLNRFEGDDAPSLASIVASPTGRRALYYDILRGAEDSTASEALLVVDNHRRFVSQGGQSVLRFQAETGIVEHDVEVGIRLHQDQVDREHVEDGFLMQGGRLVPTGLDYAPLTDNLGWAFAFAGYFVYGLEIKGLTLTPGLRTEVVKTRLDDDLLGTSQENRNAVVLPGLGARYAITEHFGVLAGVHRGFSPVAPGQPDEVKPELSVNYELGVRYLEPDEGRLLELVGFLNDYSNLTGQCAFSTGCTPDMLDRQFNGGSVFVWGAEAAAAWTFDLGKRFELPLRASYTYTGSHFREAFESDDPTFGDVEVGDEIPYVPEHQVQAQIGLSHPRGGARAVATYVGEMREEASQGGGAVFTDQQMIVDLVGWFRPIEKLKLYLRLENLLDQRPIVSRRPFGARPLRPFTLMAGAEVSF